MASFLTPGSKGFTCERIFELAQAVKAGAKHSQDHQ